jgi:hypothetical protein
MITTRVAAPALFLFGVIMAIPLSGKSQTATPWTAKQCHDRMEQLFAIGAKANDPLVDMSEVLRELNQDIGERAGSSFAIYCRMKEANSIQILMHRLESIEADRQETAAADKRSDKFGKFLEKNFNAQSTAYNPGGFAQ